LITVASLGTAGGVESLGWRRFSRRARAFRKIETLDAMFGEA
jgi:hypothetical protein